MENRIARRMCDRECILSCLENQEGKSGIDCVNDFEKKKDLHVGKAR